MPEADPVTDPPCDVDPLSVGGGLSVGPVWPLVVDDVLDVAGGLGVGDDDGLGEVVWAGFFVGEEAGVAFAVLVGVALGQPVVEPVGLVFALGERAAFALVVEVALTVAVAVTVGLTLGVIVGLGLSVGLAGGVVVLGLAGGLLVVVVGDGLALGEVFGDALADALVDGDSHNGADGEVGVPAEVAVPLRLPPTDPPAGDCPEGCWLGEEVAPLKADTTILPSPSRNGGTAASTTPTANTVTPMARAGRSMSSLQFLGRRGACRAWPAERGRAGAAVRPDHTCRKDPASCAKNPAIASRIAAILEWLA